MILPPGKFQALGAAMSPEEAVLLLQRHERARQGRLRAKLMQEIRRQEEAVADKAAKAKARAEETLTQVGSSERGGAEGGEGRGGE